MTDYEHDYIDCEHDFIDFEGRPTPKTWAEPCGVCPECGLHKHLLSKYDEGVCGRCGAEMNLTETK